MGRTAILSRNHTAYCDTEDRMSPQFDPVASCEDTIAYHIAHINPAVSQSLTPIVQSIFFSSTTSNFDKTSAVMHFTKLLLALGFSVTVMAFPSPIEGDQSLLS
jgi:hypothetical protein